MILFFFAISTGFVFSQTGFVSSQPSYPGGNEAMTTYLQEQMRYPENALKKGIEGRVQVNFSVEKDGSLSGVRVMRGVDPELDAEAIRLVMNMPKWIPAMSDKTPIRMNYILPIVFSIPVQVEAQE